MKVHTACVDTLNITIFHNGKNMLINQQFARLMLRMYNIYTVLYIIYVLKLALCRFESIVMATIHHIFFNYIVIIDKKINKKGN